MAPRGHFGECAVSLLLFDRGLEGCASRELRNGGCCNLQLLALAETLAGAGTATTLAQALRRSNNQIILILPRRMPPSIPTAIHAQPWPWSPERLGALGAQVGGFLSEHICLLRRAFDRTFS